MKGSSRRPTIGTEAMTALLIRSDQSEPSLVFSVSCVSLLTGRAPPDPVIGQWKGTFREAARLADTNLGQAVILIIGVDKTISKEQGDVRGQKFLSELRLASHGRRLWWAAHGDKLHKWWLSHGDTSLQRACSRWSRSKYNPVDPLQTITVEISKNWPAKMSPETLNFNKGRHQKRADCEWALSNWTLVKIAFSSPQIYKVNFGLTMSGWQSSPC